MNKRKDKLFKRLKDKQNRDAFVEASINVGVPFQIRALREQRKITQKEFEEISGMKQTLISRLENPNYSSFTLSTLKKIASVYDVGLIVKFVPISELVKWELNLDSESLTVLSYKDDPYFKANKKQLAKASNDKYISLYPSASSKIVCLKPKTTLSTENTKMLCCNSTATK